jgi:Ran GTPase-activating protein (RanGAP) involved in mRNA processing and transport
MTSEPRKTLKMSDLTSEEDLEKAIRNNLSEDTRRLNRLAIDARGGQQMLDEEKFRAVLRSCMLYNVCLESLRLYGVPISNKNAAALSTLLSCSTSLRTLVIQKCKVQTRACRTLMDGLSGNSSVTSVNLSENCLGPRGAEIVAEMLRQQSCLQNLDISDNCILDFGANAIGQSICSTSAPRLQSLFLGQNRLTLTSCQAFFRGIRQASSLRTLDLFCNDLEDEAACTLAESLGDSASIEQVFLSLNYIGPKGCEALAAWLEKSTSLRTLDLAEAFLPHTSIVPIAKALAKASVAKVERLNLGGNNCRPDDIHAIAAAISANTTLHSLVRV